MFSHKNWSLPTSLLTIFLALAHPAVAETKLEINYDTQAFTNRELTSGKIRVVVDYQPLDLTKPEQNNLSYRIFYNGVEQVNQQTETYTVGSIFLQDLDGNKTSEVIISTYSGGAHCCTNFTIYTWQNNNFISTETGYLDGGGGEFKDLDRDKKVEFLTYDNAFLYKFSSYAGSYPPSVILRLNNGKFEEVTRRYPQELRAQAWRMYQTLLEVKKEGITEINGILAGYVAQKILLGEYQQGWDFMLTHYDRSSDWGLEIYRGDQIVGKYPDFPSALRAFLIEQGYLKYEL